MTDNNTVEKVLKPCPFCGANEEGFRLGNTGCPKVEELSEGGWRVTCYTCRYSICWQPFPTREAAITAWNTRAAINAMSDVREALTKARDTFRFYEREHAAKAEKIEEANGPNSTAVGRREKEQRNREMANMLDAALEVYQVEGPVTEDTVEKVARDRADWLLDAVAGATQDRRFLRGDPEYDAVAGDAILLNGEKAIRAAINAMSDVREALTAEELFEIARPCFHYAPADTPDGRMFTNSEQGRLLMKAMRKIAALESLSGGGVK